MKDSKADKFEIKSTLTAVKIFRKEKEQGELSIINFHAPPRRKISSQEEKFSNWWFLQ